MKSKTKWVFIIVVLIILTMISFIVVGIISLFIGLDIEAISGNVALIPVKGLISAGNGEGLFAEEVASSTEIVEFIEKADKNPNIKAMIFEINSPGGSAVASEEIANAIKKTNKTTVAWIREVGASGAYWVASSSDYIVANRMSITGSVGVIASYLEFADLLQEYNVTYQRLVAGEYKDIGSPLKELSKDEKRILQEKLDVIHGFFIDEIAKNRRLPRSKAEEFSSGVFYIGSEAKDLGLVDILGGKEEAIKIIEKKLNITVKLAEYKREKTLLDVLSKLFHENSFFVGKGIGSAFFDKAKTPNSLNVYT